MLGIRPAMNYSNYHNREDDTCPKPKHNFRWSSKTELSHHRSSLDQLRLACCVIFNMNSKKDTEYHPGWSQTWRTASSTVRSVAVISKLSLRPVEPVFFHQSHLDLTCLSPNSQFGPIIHEKKGGALWDQRESMEP